MKKTMMNWIMAVSILCTITSCNKDEIDIEGVAEFNEYIKDEMDFQKIPAMSVLVFKGDDILYENYFGHSNLQQNVSLAKDHLFLMASVSKVVTATALLQLYEEGLFSLNDNINNYLPFTVTVPNRCYYFPNAIDPYLWN